MFYIFSGKSTEKTKTPAYRPYYGCLGEIRSLVGPKIAVVALTATASTNKSGIILKELCMTKQVYKLVGIRIRKTLNIGCLRQQKRGVI